MSAATTSNPPRIAYPRPFGDKQRGPQGKTPDEGVLRVRELASEVADAADADQWAIAVVGIGGIGAPDFDELVPRCYLEGLNAGRPAHYRMTLVLKTRGKDLGVLRLATVRPGGFTDLDVAHARAAARSATDQIARSLQPTAQLA